MDEAFNRTMSDEELEESKVKALFVLDLLIDQIPNGKLWHAAYDCVMALQDDLGKTIQDCVRERL